tara:strand:+ start:62032 stop:62301 length:270 start_codon:yes stop_codon:yes gene_type:complete
MLILGLNQVCFPHRKVRDSLCVYFIFNQKMCDMLKRRGEDGTEPPFGLMFNLFEATRRRPDPDDDPTDPEATEGEGSSDPPVHPPGSGN